jgi:uncharacterized protein (TIGR03435 family)
MLRILQAGLVVAMSSTTFGQSFEVASIRPHPGDPHSINITTSGPRLTAEAETVFGLLMYAYELKSYQLADSPAYSTVGDNYYDIVAKAEGDGEPTQAEFRHMMQSLLADRFKLKIHRETREMPVYVLTVGKGGPKFKESAPDALGLGNHGVNGRIQTLTLPNATMDQVAGELRVYAGDRPILDKTGLTGTYAIKFEATPAFRMRNPDPEDISVFTAVQEQLGLKLEAQKGMVEVLVVDHVEKPSAN